MADVIKAGEKVILHHKAIGFVRGTMEEDFTIGPGTAIYNVYVNSELLPGVDKMTLNVNQWELYREDDPKVLKKIATEFVKPYWTR